MAGVDDKNDFYAVLGLKKECTSTELRHAYKKLALKWHPDRFSALENPKYVDEAKKKFQAIQQAYSVLSDSNKRFLYDVGVYDCDDDDENDGMGEFLNEMATMMAQTKFDGSGNETMEELQKLFDEMFQSDIDGFGSSVTPPTCSSSSSTSGNEACSTSDFEGFCMGTGGESGRRKNARKGRK